MNLKLLRQAGIALPVMLMILLTMAITSIYLIKSVNSATINSANAAYESALVRAADAGLHAGFTWLANTARVQGARLNNAVGTEGYSPIFNPNIGPRDPGFWNGSKTVDSPEGRVEYVIHRMCSAAGSYDQIAPVNTCMMTSEADDTPPTLPVGESQLPENGLFAGAPQVHYLITARLQGPRGGNVVNQMVVLIGV